MLGGGRRTSCDWRLRVGANQEPEWAFLPTSGAGAAITGGRFNRPGVEALYLARREQTALAEFRQDNAFLPPGTICTYRVSGLRVADITDGFDPNEWDPIWEHHAIDWRREWFGHKVEPPTWIMGDLVLDAHLHGILFPSAADLGGVNLVIFNSSQLGQDRLAVYDPYGDLPRNQSSWR